MSLVIHIHLKCIESFCHYNECVSVSIMIILILLKIEPRYSFGSNIQSIGTI